MTPSGASSVSELYKSYKKLTNSFLSWLWCQHRLKAPSDAALNFRSTADILEIAKVLQNARLSVPSSVIGFLRGAIEKRKLVANIYRQFGAGHDGHDAFNDRLEEILSILTPLVEPLGAPLINKPDTEGLAAGNLFSRLPRVESEPDDQSTPVEAGHQHCSSPMSSSKTTNTTRESVMPSYFCLEDDKITEVFDAAYFLMELDNVHKVLRKCWADASHGNIPLPLAAWMNNFAMYSIARDIPPKFVYVCSHLSMNPESTCAFFSRLSDKIDPATLLSHARRFFMLAQAINDYGRTLIGKPMLAIQGAGVACNTPECQCKFNIPHGIVPSGDLKGDEISESDKATVLSIFDTVRDDLTNKRVISMLEAKKPTKCGCFTPICDAFLFGASIFFSQTVPIASSRLVAGLNLFFLTEESVIMTPDANITRPHSRFKPIRLAIDFRNSLLPVMETLKAMTPNCGRAEYWHKELQTVLDGLKAYASERKFDTYHTSPWIAGCHMTEILTAAHSFGFLINSEWAVISSTLHLYNAMRHSVASTPEIPVFEDLSQLLIQCIFGGNLPKRNFCSTFRRIVYHSKVEKIANAEGKLYRLEAGLTNRPETMEIDSSFIDQHYSNHENGPLFQGQVLGIAYQPELGPKSYQKIAEARSKLTLSEYMEKAKSAALLDLEGPHPTARVNLFAVFTLCSKFLNKFGSLEKASIPMEKFELFPIGEALRNDIVVGRCVAELVMESIDDFSNSKQGRRQLKRMRSPGNAVRAFKEIDPETTLSQCLWNL